MLNRRFSLGSYFGIGLYVHWTFSLLLLAVAGEKLTGGASWIDATVAIGLVVAMYFCVTLHEYGHALTARCFGVGTRDITLLPIGGVARLERMPRVPVQELLIAVAGPAVNVVIAFLLGGGWLVAGLIQPDWMPSLATLNLDQPMSAWSLREFTLVILIANLALVVFNLIPAFPMDGGRVLRSLLAMGMTYRRATFWASRVGLAMAVLMGMFALMNGLYVILLISLFVGWAGTMEARQVNMADSVEGIRVRDAMIQWEDVPTVRTSDSIQSVAIAYRRQPMAIMPVRNADGQFFGIVTLRGLSDAIGKGQESDPVATITVTKVPAVYPEQTIAAVLSNGSTRRLRQLPVVGYHDEVIGLLDLDTLLLRASLPKFVDFFARNPPGDATNPGGGTKPCD